jgi:hypothetical protein
MAVAAAAARRRNSPTLNAVPVVTPTTQPVLSSSTGPLPALSIDISTPIEYDDSDLDDEDLGQIAESVVAFRMSLPVLAQVLCSWASHQSIQFFQTDFAFFVSQLESIYVWEVNASWISSVHVASAVDFKTLGSASAVSSVDRVAVLFACTDSGFSVLYSDGTTSAFSDISAQSPSTHIIKSYFFLMISSSTLIVLQIPFHLSRYRPRCSQTLHCSPTVRITRTLCI